MYDVTRRERERGMKRVMSRKRMGGCARAAAANTNDGWMERGYYIRFVDNTQYIHESVKAGQVRSDQHDKNV